MVKNTSTLHKMDASSSPSALLPRLETQQEVLCLVKPQGKKSRFWVHFSEYDTEAHPDKVKYARCNLCGRNISVKQGTGGLKNHLKFKHPAENALLFSYSDEIGRENADASAVVASALGATSTNPSAAAAADAVSPPKKKVKISLQDITSRMDSEKRAKQKQDLEMWSTVRREIKELKKELATEEDEEDRRDLENDIKNLKKMKAGLDQQLGFCSGSADAMV
mmetsp:Transcript_15467/g.24004  ORF Transcript_15467/g.24004 Transcript_15467/m.24004 type:complete len:222 (+) Transcript_15467:105-770(+)|eukprot:CAMPEP_0201729692 /NCGR_PEP_ID=MMETSP0593-20130828/19744_1 /ASSEMBLY_ACC=CAM_ASM_000672 /TAXON_ID=267983 /ORGANISM="Skeletonema japonicum, Strain CCMP2506" /LENGTH=221 /DNA_ID=CAMNT_0048222077 /DNA_START=40 /DNA_END=705 /DNA_ORIENTATION=+